MNLTTVVPAIAVLLTLSVGPVPVRAVDVEPIFTKQCASCHGKDGSGNTKAGKLAGAKDLRDAKIQKELTDAKIFEVIKEGVKSGDKVKMKPIKDASDDDIKALVAYVRKFKDKQ